MKSKQLFVYVLGVILACLGNIRAGIPITIEVLETFDYPGTGNLTRPQKINDQRDIVGVYVDSSGVNRGFFRAANGRFSAPIVEPNDAGNFTEARGINDSRTICGDYTGSDGLIHGFFLSGSTYTEYDVPDSSLTDVLGINNSGDFVGGFTPNSTGISQPFTNIGGTVTPIDIPGSTFGFAYQLSNINPHVHRSQYYVGYYGDSASVTHGFYLDESSVLQFPVDPPGSTGTILFGVNYKGWMVGRFSDSAGATHGFLLLQHGKLVKFDYPGSTFTSLNGINGKGYICGRYTDEAGIEHGFTARATTSGDEAEVEVNATIPSSPVRTTKPSSPAQPNQVPAS